MKNILIGLAIVAVIGLIAQVMINNKERSTAQSQINDLGTIASTDKASALERLSGKPAVIFIVGTFCPHCQSAMPKYKTQIWDVYKEAANIFANVTDGQDGKRFEVADIAQGYDAQLDFQAITGEECNFVPSWILLDADSKVIDSSCGAKKGTEVITAGLDALLTPVIESKTEETTE